jgi:Asp/Glu/hydantoin racemase
MRIAVINPNTSEPVTSHILAAAREVASLPASLVAFTAARGPTAIELAHRCASVVPTGLTVLESGSGSAASKARIVEQGRLEVRRDHAEVLVLGCAGMSGLVDAVRRGTGVPVVDCIRAAVVLAEGLFRCRLATSKAGAFAYPERLPFAGMTAPSQVVGKHPLADAP